jgi:polyisoprenoid-binding protein YceI
MIKQLNAISALVFVSGAIALAANNVGATPAAVESGTAAFIATTNVSAINIKGKSTALQAHVQIRRNSEGMQLQNIEATVPVKTLLTGMGVRDDHMRKYIFTTADGKTPDLRFEAESATCAAGGRETACPVTGTLSIRGVAKPFSITLKVREESSGLKTYADGIVKLSDYGIEQPSEFGVKTTNEVQLHFDFTAKQTVVVSANAEGER